MACPTTIAMNTTMGLNTTNTTMVNYTGYDTTHDETYHYVTTVVVGSLSTIITITNVVVILTYCLAKKIRGKTANLLLCDQAVVDAYNGIVVGGLTVMSYALTLDHQNWWPLLIQTVYQLSIGVSIHTILLISVERYIFILKPLFHRSSVTKGRMLVAVAGSWVASFVWIPLRLVNWHEDDEEKAYQIFIAIFDCYILLLTVTVGCLHVLTYRAVKRFIMHRHKDLLVRSTPGKTAHHKENIKVKQHMKEMRVSKIFIAMFVAFICTYIPVFLSGLVFISGVYKLLPNSAYKYFSLDLIFYLCNSICNPFLTLLFKEDYRKNVRKFFTTVHSLTVFTRQYTLTRHPSSSVNSNWRKTLMTTINSTVRGTPERKRRNASGVSNNKRLTRADLINIPSGASTPPGNRQRGVNLTSADARRKAFARSKPLASPGVGGKFNLTQQLLSASEEDCAKFTGHLSVHSSCASSNDRLIDSQVKPLDEEKSPLFLQDDNTNSKNPYSSVNTGNTVVKAPLFCRAAKYAANERVY